jgi:hypothetical protein
VFAEFLLGLRQLLLALREGRESLLHRCGGSLRFLDGVPGLKGDRQLLDGRLLGGELGLQCGDALPLGIDFPALGREPLLAGANVRVGRAQLRGALVELRGLAGDVRLLREPALVGLDLLGESRPQLLFPLTAARISLRTESSSRFNAGTAPSSAAADAASAAAGGGAA